MRLILGLGIFVLAHQASIHLGYFLQYSAQSVAMVWFSSGALAAALLLAKRRLWGVLLALASSSEVVGNFYYMGSLRDFDLATLGVATSVGGCHVAEGVTAAYLVGRFGGRPLQSSRVRTLLAVVVGAAVLASGIWSLVGALIWDSANEAILFSLSWGVWWAGNALGMLTIVPLAMSARSRLKRIGDRGLDRWLLLEYLILVSLVLVLGTLSFQDKSPPLRDLFGFPYLLFPLVIWAGARFRVLGVSSANFVVVIMLALFTDSGRGPFVQSGTTLHADVLAMQTFLVVLTLSGLALATFLHELECARVERVKAEARMLLTSHLDEVGRQAAGVAHDLNNALMVVSGSLDLMDEYLGQGRAEAVRESVNDMRLASRRATELVKKLLVEPQAGEESRETTELRCAMDVDLAALRRQYSERAKVEWKSLDRACTVEIDRLSLGRVLSNLIKNAVEAIPPGQQGRVAVGVERQGERVEVSVEDDGAGMDESTLSRVFEPYFSTKGEAGVGVGLAVVKGLIERRGGDVRVESVSSRGTRVTLRFVLSHAEESA
ncbi:MAG: MASE1 domain-containing protein [Planctomycetota bacterium]